MNPESPRRECRTRDGQPFLIRPLHRDDSALELDFVRRLSPQSRYQRLMYSVAVASPALIEGLLDVDGDRRVALVAILPRASAAANPAGSAPESIVGVARYAASSRAGDCEFAVAVADAWQGRGIGSALMRELIPWARSRGFTRMVGSVLADNGAMLRLAASLGFATGEVLQGTQELELCLAPAQPAPCCPA